MPLSVGDILGPYEILAPIGAGGMGEVWKACDTRLDRIVAIKRLNPKHAARFQQEARAIAALNHPHICQIYDVGPDYLVLEYIEGAPLRGPIPLEAAMKLALQIAGALETAHKKNILHRDLKPANILVTESGAKLLDFGLAKLMADPDPQTTQTVEGAVIGTAAYMSPEQAQGKATDERSDIFSFGAVLYEVLSGRRAFADTSMLDVLNAVVRRDLPPLDSPLAGVVQRCLAKKADARFQSVAEMRAALERIDCRSEERQASIAVLPFANMSGDKEQEYFSDGLAEEIINALAQSPELKITARTSAFSFKGKDTKVAQIALELGVEHILEGSMRKAGNRIRVTAQLIKACDGFHLWSERYDRELSDIFALQDELSTAITTALKAKLSVKSKRRKQYTPNVAAYEAYLKGTHHLWQQARERSRRDSLERCRECYEEAIRLDPQFALSYSALATYYHIAASSIMDPREAAARGRENATKALELDPFLAEAHAWLGIFAIVYDLDWQEGSRRFQLAMACEPVSPIVRHLYGYFLLRHLGRAKEAVEQHRRALEEDPLNLIIRVGLATCLREAGQDQEAAAEARKILELEPDAFAAFALQAFDFTWEPLDKALAWAERGHALSSPWFSPSSGLLAGLLVKAGDPARARVVLGELEGSERCSAFTIYHLLCGELELAVDWMEKAIRRKEQMVTMLLLPTPWGPMLRRSPRWPQLAAMMNLPEGVRFGSTERGSSPAS
jgi:TolB-like protein/Tfp pilus assembly protein PilF